MRTVPNHRRRVLAALCALLVLLRMDGDHWHLCFDGSEPPASVQHFADAHAAPHAQGQSQLHLLAPAPHQDVDIDLPTAAGGRGEGPHGDAVSPCIATLCLAFLLPVRRAALPALEPASAPLTRTHHRLLPPGRAPPATIPA